MSARNLILAAAMGIETKLAVEDVFSTVTYTAGGASQNSLYTGVDLASKGGMMWFKQQTSSTPHALVDTVRGPYKYWNTASTAAQSTNPLAGTNDILSFTNTGITYGPAYSDAIANTNDISVAWNFASHPRFFQAVSYVGNGSALSIPHGLQGAPGFVMIKGVSAGGPAIVYHRGFPAQTYMTMSSAAAQASNAQIFPTLPDASNIYVGSNTNVNASGAQYMAYCWAHDTAADGVIQCGTMRYPSTSVSLGWAPQYVLYSVPDGGNWTIMDTVRGFALAGTPVVHYANLNQPQQSLGWFTRTSTGFQRNSAPLQDYIYVAIRVPGARIFTTYQQFEAWANAQGTFTAANGTTNINYTANTYLINNTAQNTGFMGGSSHGNPNSFTPLYSSSNFSRVLQHAYPSQAAYNAGLNQKSIGQFVAVGYSAAFYQFPSVNRNGYASERSYTGDEMPQMIMTQFIYWDPVLGKAMRRNPSEGDTGAGIPVEFNGII